LVDFDAQKQKIAEYSGFLFSNHNNSLKDNALNSGRRAHYGTGFDIEFLKQEAFQSALWG